jgi:thiamine kinase-like enzyme
VRPEDIAARVWPGHELRVEPLGGGITNENFRVDVGAETCVLRIGGKDTELLGIDRDIEHETAKVAAACGIGPEVVDFVRPEGYLVTRFIEGKPVPPERMRTPEGTTAVVQAMHEIHDGPPIPGAFDSFRVVEDYARIAEEHGVKLPPAYGRAHETSARIEQARGQVRTRPCHNDLLNANFIDDGVRLRIVDWEYAGMGDVFFDLANFSVNHDFETSHDAFLLECYFGKLDQKHVRALRVMRFMSDFREAMWGVVQQGISELDFDFVAYADEHFERLDKIGDDPDFKRALE